MANPFRRASKVQLKLRMALIGPAGSGKTYSALNIGQHLGEKIAVVDTEHGSASKYAGLFAFDVLELGSFHPQMYIDAISAAEQAGYGVLIIDSLSHAWMGKDGALELVDKAAKRSPSGNSFAAWRDVTPLHNKLIEAMLAAKLHLIVTMRSKMEYVQDKDDKGRTVIRKVGLQPVQRDGLEYEFDVVADLDTDNTLIVGKTRCPQLTGVVLPKPGKDIADTLKAWLADGTPSAALPRVPQPESSQAPSAAPTPAQAPAQSAGNGQPAPTPRPTQPPSRPGETSADIGAESVVVTFGKHQGKCLGRIMIEDPGYIQYLAANAKGDALRAAAQQLAKGAGAQKPTAAQPATTGPDDGACYINDEQRKRLYALVEECGLPNEAVREWLTARQIPSARHLTPQTYGELLIWLEEQHKAMAEIDTGETFGDETDGPF